MSISIGGVDLFRQGLENEYRITVLEMILEKILERNPACVTQQEVDRIKKDALKLLQKKYPEAPLNKGEN